MTSPGSVPPQMPVIKNFIIYDEQEVLEFRKDDSGQQQPYMYKLPSPKVGEYLAIFAEQKRLSEPLKSANESPRRMG